MDEIRRRRVEEQIRDEIAALIMGGDVKDPRIGPFVSVTRVEAARDLSTARVFVSSFASVAAPAPAGGEPAAAPAAAEAPVHEADPALDRAVAGLQSAAGYIQAQVARRIKLRLTPRLHFIPDRGIKDGFELNERIKGLFS
ncbi:MAG TPA: ribosome-binding factor A [Rectinemataceae bacterium]|nr:ribosome-binding factor A [Rectinemataceae bacterium]